MQINQTHNPQVRSYLLALIEHRSEWTCECGAAAGDFATVEEAEAAAHLHQSDAIRERLLAQLTEVI